VPLPSAPLPGVAAGTAAGLIWGLAFLLPVLLHGWTPVAVTAGRYLAYGALSALLCTIGGARVRRLAIRHWRPALAYAVAGNVGYYLLLVLGIALVGAPVTDLVIGSIPVVMAVCGNLVDARYRWRDLAVPVVLTGAGLGLVNLLAIGGATPQAGGMAEHTTTARAVAGVLCASAAVLAWTWYGLANARFLAEHPEVPGAGWSTVVGLGTGVVTLVALPIALVTGQLDQPSTIDGGTGPAGFVIASLVLGILVSWAATGLWNVASARLSPTAAGMLINIETVSGYAYVYAARAQWPPVGQLIGLGLILAGVVLVVRLPVAEAPAPRRATVAPLSGAAHGRAKNVALRIRRDQRLSPDVDG
jgi:drug/metabolite transporter (DMT)-like permease